MVFYVLLALLLPFAGTNSTHDFHVSVAEFDWDSRTGEMTVAMHIFIDDLEKGLGEMGAGDSLFIGTAFERSDADGWIDQYARDRLAIRADQEEIELNWIGKELSDDLQAVWVYLAADHPVRQITRLEFRYDLLMEIYDDQKNLLNLRVDREQRTSLLFSGRKTRNSYELD